MMRVKKNDKVAVITGKNKGKQGTIIEILPKEGKVKVKDVAIVTRHRKARKQGETSAIVKSESFIDISNIMPICGSCKKPTRVGSKIVNEKKALICKRCNEIM